MKMRIVAVGLLALAMLAGASPVAAVEPHENPDTAPLVFDGVALLQKYSQALDNVLSKNATGVEQLQEQSTLANIPDVLRNTVDNFLSSGYSLGGLIPMIEADLENSKEMLRQYRLDETKQSVASAKDKLNQAYSVLGVMERAASDTGRWWQADTARPGSSLRQVYDEVQAKLLSLRRLLDLSFDMHYSLTQQSETLIATSGLILRPTNLTLTIEPETAFVGDKVTFRGVFSAEGEPLSGRIVTLLLDHSPVSSFLTGSDGIFHGEVALPYRYVSEMNLQALYYPVGNDIGQYLGSSSPVVTIKVLYYETGLNLEVPQTAYPGRKLVLKGNLDYGGNPVPEERLLSLYQDGELAAEATVGTTFPLELMIAENTSMGRHRLTLYIAPQKRYAPAQSAVDLEVIKVTPVIEADVTRVVLLPFTQDIRGKVYSSLGPLRNAGLEIVLGGRTVSTRSLDDGTFHARLGTGMSLTLLGSQDLRITVTPVEPWYRTASLVISLLVINPANMLLLALAIAIPALLSLSRLRKRVVATAVSPLPELVPALVKKESPPRLGILDPGANGTPDPILLNLYRGILRLVQEATALVLSPYHTLREFARESAPGLGVFGGYFQEFTAMIERLLYSRHRLTETDTARAREISQRLKEGVKSAGT